MAASLLTSPPALAAAAAAGTGLAAFYLLDEKVGIANDARLVKGQVDFVVQSRRHMFASHTVADVWEETAARYGPKQALVFAGPADRPRGAPYAFSFDQVNAQANRVARFLSAQGLSSGACVGLLMTNRPEFVWSALGCAKAGLTVSFLNFNLRPQQLAHCIAICDASAILYEDCFDAAVAEALVHLREQHNGGSAQQQQPIKQLRYATTFAGSGGSSGSSPAAASDAVVHAAAWLPLLPDTNLPRSARAGRTMLSPWGFVYTSGTTGLPKAAVITNLRFFMGGYLMTGVTGLTGADRVYTVLPLYHSAGGLIGIGSMVCRGATAIISPKFSARRFWDDVHEHRATVVQYIGELCRYLVGSPDHPLERKHRVRMAIGNGLRPDVWPKFQSRFGIPIVSEFYASTEGNASLVNVCVKPADQGAVGHFGALVRSLGLFRIAKYDEDTEDLVRGPDGACIECAPGEVGELLGYLKLDDKTGLRTFAGYHGNKEATEKKIARDVFARGDAWFRTGDLLRVSPEGRYYFVDRIGDTFRWRGENVATTEVAEVLSQFPGVEEVNVYGVAVPGAEGRAGMAALVLKEAPRADGTAGGAAAAVAEGAADPGPGRLPAGFDLRALAAFARENLPPYAVPLFLRVLPHVPLTSTFKHLKKELRDEGADPTRVRDELYVLFPAGSGNGEGAGEGAKAGGAYERLTLARWHDIVAGKARL
jgi:fatty-acyl-CoA synthase